MPNIYPFQAIRPLPKNCARVAAPPYDVVTAPEAESIILANPSSFLRISLPGADPKFCKLAGKEFDHAWAKENLQEFLRDELLICDSMDSLYLYRMRSENHSQVGLVCALDALEASQGAVKIHELTRPEKEQDRLDHMAACQAQTEPILLAFKNENNVPSVWAAALKESPLFEFTDQEFVRHEVWKITDASLEAKMVQAFRGVPHFYIADGHHRYAAAVRLQSLQKNPGQKILAVIFPHDQLQILAYHRVVLADSRFAPQKLWQGIGEHFRLESVGRNFSFQPQEFGLFAQGKWTKLVYRKRKDHSPIPLPNLDVTLLHETILEPLLGIRDERRDPRLEFVGGLAAKNKIEKLVNENKQKFGFFLHPVSILDLFALADQNQVMPPKSTWFEPKLKSGLFVLPYF